MNHQSFSKITVQPTPEAEGTRECPCLEYSDKSSTSKRNVDDDKENDDDGRLTKKKKGSSTLPCLEPQGSVVETSMYEAHLAKVFCMKINVTY